MSSGWPPTQPPSLRVGNHVSAPTACFVRPVLLFQRRSDPGAISYLENRCMIETNVQLTVRCLDVTGQDLTPEFLHKACDRLRKTRKLPAVPSPRENVILVVSNQPVKPLKMEKSDWYLEAEDTGKTRVLRFGNPGEAELLAKLFERGMMSRLENKTGRWRINGRPRVFYDRKPFQSERDIEAFRSYQASCVPIDGVGLGIAIEVGTAPLTAFTVADYFRDDVSPERYDELQRRFNQLRDRQNGRKGTLLYNNKRTNTTCYFDSFPPGVTCGTTGKLKIENEWYSSLTDYYKRKHGVTVNDNDPVVKVSFKNSNGSTNGLNKPVFIAAHMARLRVMNDHLPRSLKQADKLTPMRRDILITQLWEKLCYEPLGQGFPKVSRHSWRPSSGKSLLIPPPSLTLADGVAHYGPVTASIDAYRKYYRTRRGLLDEFGCYDVHPTVSRVLHIAVPDSVKQPVIDALGDAVSSCLSKWTRKTISWNPVRYSSLDDAFMKLRRVEEPGLTFFILGEEDDVDEAGPETYYLVAHELKEWRIKRLTQRNLLAKFQKLRNGDGSRDWDSFIEMNALDILQQMDCVPWSLKDGLYYPAHLAIDVGEGRKHFGVSLLVCNPDVGTPKFFHKTMVFEKPDEKSEEINPRLLEKAILTVCEEAVKKHSNFTKLPSLLVLRDGRECGEELPAILGVRDKLAEIDFLDGSGLIAPVDVHKKTSKGFRLWEREQRNNRLRNTLEGQAVLLDSRTAILNNTGAATLTQATAIPVVLSARHERVDIREAATDFFMTSQFNYSSPGVAQRLALTLKRLDDELRSRTAQVSRFLK